MGDPQPTLSWEYSRLHILEEDDNCDQRGQLGALRRRQRAQGQLQGLAARHLQAKAESRQTSPLPLVGQASIAVAWCNDVDGRNIHEITFGT